MIDKVSLFLKMLTCRRVEEAIASLWHEGLISGEMHLGIGEEGINAGVMDHLGNGDAVSLDHRGTAGMLLAGVDTTAIIKECMGIEDGLCLGVGGHMHLFSKNHLAASSGIVGSSGPTACGFALAAQHLRPKKVAVCFFGEGAMNQGMLMESMNLAAAWNLPVLFVCRDNGMSITTPSPSVTPGNLEERVQGLGLPAKRIDGTDAEVVWKEAGLMLDRARNGKGPSFLRASCLRPQGHFLGDPLLRMVHNPLPELLPRTGPLFSSAIGSGGASLRQRIASISKIMAMIARAARTQLGNKHDPVLRIRKNLQIKTDELTALEREVDHKVEAALKKALLSLPEGKKEATQ